MATPKKTHTTKKTPVTKKALVKAKAMKRPPRLTWRFYAVTIGIFLVAVTTVVVAAYLAAGVVAKQNTQARLDRINGIYASLNVGESYQVEKSNVFGDKRAYSDDKSRTHASSVEYIHPDTVSNTVADLDAKIKAAGFTFVEEPSPASTSVQYHYKSTDGEYVQLTVFSKPYHDALHNGMTMGRNQDEAVRGLDKNAGPATVIIRVNLDDNNE